MGSNISVQSVEADTRLKIKLAMPNIGSNWTVYICLKDNRYPSYNLLLNGNNNRLKFTVDVNTGDTLSVDALLGDFTWTIGQFTMFNVDFLKDRIKMYEADTGKILFEIEDPNLKNVEWVYFACSSSGHQAVPVSQQSLSSPQTLQTVSWVLISLFLIVLLVLFGTSISLGLKK